MIDPSRREIPCPTSEPPELETWFVKREGKACYFDQYTQAAHAKVMAEIDCPPDNATAIKEISPGVCQTALDDRKVPQPNASKFTPKPVPCPPRA